jgi:hypothetical protein
VGYPADILLSGFGLKHHHLVLARRYLHAWRTITAMLPNNPISFSTFLTCPRFCRLLAVPLNASMEIHTLKKGAEGPKYDHDN